MRRRRYFLVVAALILTISGCTQPAEKKAPTTKGSSPTETAPAAEGGMLLAFVTNNAFDFWNIADKGTQKAVQELKDKGVEVTVEFRKPTQGAAEQKRIIEALLAKGVKGIAVSPNDAKNMEPFYRDTVNKAVPLIMQDSDLNDPHARRCYIGTNNYIAGRAVGELVARACPEGGKIAIFVGQMDVQNARERRQGVLDYLRDPGSDQKEMKEMTDPGATDLKVGKFTLVATMTDQRKQDFCQTQARQLLLQHPDTVCLIGLWAYNPPALLGAVRQSSQLKKKPVLIGFDEDYETLKGIQSGELFGTVVQNPFEFGRQSILLLNGLARGDESVLKSRSDIDRDNRIFIPHRVITKDNVDPFFAELKTLKGS